MNYFTELSIELANNRDYLDQLFRVYPLAPESVRYVDGEKWDKVELAFQIRDNVSLINALLDLDLFPVKDGYVPYFRHDRTAINRNPQTVNRICGRIYELGIEELWKKCSQPKETNRQMGQLFRRWLDNSGVGIQPVSEKVFLSDNNNAVLAGNDQQLKEFASKHCGYERDDKGVDLIARFNNKLVVGEAKFISDEGGHQNGQFLDSMTMLHTKAPEDVIYVAVLDGVLYIPSKKKMYTHITKNDENVMSALVLRDFLYSL